MRMAGRSWAVGALLAAGVAVAPVSAQEFSEEAVRKVMEYAWSLTPQSYTTPNGETIQIDKKKKDEVVVPLEVARLVVRAGTLSAYAQECELALEQKNNFGALNKRLDQMQKWTPQQRVYLNQLHQTTLMYLTGRLAVVFEDEAGDKEVVIVKGTGEPRTCTDEDREKIRTAIAADLKNNLGLAAGRAPAPAAAADASATQPAVAPAKQ